MGFVRGLLSFRNKTAAVPVLVGAPGWSRLFGTAKLFDWILTHRTYALDATQGAAGRAIGCRSQAKRLAGRGNHAATFVRGPIRRRRNAR
jgi:hypothetical protein